MKIIVSHDVDHLNWSEHVVKDFFIWKYILRNLLYLLRGEIHIDVFSKRVRIMSNDRYNRLPELCRFNKEHNIPATFFLAMNNALGLSYSRSAAAKAIDFLHREGFATGVHGIAYDCYEEMKKEYVDFSKLASTRFGIRNHYLRIAGATLNYQNKLGYLYGSTTYAIENPKRIGSMWEIPISVMDAYVARPNELDLARMQMRTMQLLDEAIRKNIPFFVVNFHAVLYDKATIEYKQWYEWLMKHFIDEGYEFTSFQEAVKELDLGYE